MNAIKPKCIGILGGSFNPVHIGHMLVASNILCNSSVDEVWLMLSPDNPLKQRPGNSPSEQERYEMLEIACRPHTKIHPCGIELDMPRPSYTIDSLHRLSELHPENDYRLIIGSDNWLIFHQWRDWQEIIKQYPPIIYQRPDYPIDTGTLPDSVGYLHHAQFDISSTFIRDTMSKDCIMARNMAAFFPCGVYDYIMHNKLYQKR